jgi:hypothetical protein
MSRLLRKAILVLTLAVAANLSAPGTAQAAECTCIPGGECWTEGPEICGAGNWACGVSSSVCDDDDGGEDNLCCVA